MPEAEFEERDQSNELLHVLYGLNQNTQISGLRHLRSGSGRQIVADMPFRPPRWRGISVDDGRLMVAINFNMDMGDVWEQASNPAYQVPMTSLAYRFGINDLIYTMTH